MDFVKILVTGYYQTTNPEVFMVFSTSQKHRIPSYEIRTLPPKNELIQGFFRDHELVFVSKTTKFSVKKTLRQNKSKTMSLVQYDGLDDSFTDWISTQDVKSANGKAKFMPLLKYANLQNDVSNEF